MKKFITLILLFIPFGISIANFHSPYIPKKYEIIDLKLQHSIHKVNRFDNLIQKYALKYHVDPLLIKAIILHESKGKISARGKVGDSGLMQVLPSNFKKGWERNNRYSPDINIKVGTAFLKTCTNARHGNLINTIACYNRGFRKSKQGEKRYPEKYVKVVLRNYAIFKSLEKRNS